MWGQAVFDPAQHHLSSCKPVERFSTLGKAGELQENVAKQAGGGGGGMRAAFHGSCVTGSA